MMLNADGCYITNVLELVAFPCLQEFSNPILQQDKGAVHILSKSVNRERGLHISYF